MANEGEDNVEKVAEGRGDTVEDAIADALTQLGLAREEVTVEIIAEGRRGLFGGGRRAHVRVIANLPSAPEAEAPDAQSAEEEPVADDRETATQEPVETTEESGGDERSFQELDPEERMDMLDEEADQAADFIEGLLDMLDLPGDIEIEIQEEQAIVTVQDVGTGILIGRRGATLDALQELVRCTVQRSTQRRSHVRVDVEGYRARQLEKLRDKCREAIAQVRETGKPVRLEPMDPYERKMMHDLVARTGGVTSSSEGSEPRRRVVINPE